MAATQGEITVNTSDPPSPPRRPTRSAKPSAKQRYHAARDIENNARTEWSEQRGRDRKVGASEAPGGDQEQRDEMREIVKEQGNTICELFDVVMRQQNAISELHHQLRQVENALADTKAQLSEELRQVRDQMDVLARNPGAGTSAETSPRASYADVARTPPGSQLSALRTLSLLNTMPTTVTDTLFCTLDISRVEERERGKVQVVDIRKAIETKIQTRENQGN